jgi:hypothetical protein
LTEMKLSDASIGVSQMETAHQMFISNQSFSFHFKDCANILDILFGSKLPPTPRIAHLNVGGSLLPIRSISSAFKSPTPTEASGNFEFKSDVFDDFSQKLNSRPKLAPVLLMTQLTILGEIRIIPIRPRDCSNT